MKRLAAWILTLACVWVLTGCCNRSMDYIIQHEPNISGTVKKSGMSRSSFPSRQPATLPAQIVRFLWT